MKRIMKFRIDTCKSRFSGVSLIILNTCLLSRGRTFSFHFHYIQLFFSPSLSSWYCHRASLSCIYTCCVRVALHSNTPCRKKIPEKFGNLKINIKTVLFVISESVCFSNLIIVDDARKFHNSLQALTFSVPS